jgi:hypothetical protein
MGGQPWPSSKSINDGMASSQERKGREGEGARLGVRLGEGESCRGSTMGAQPSVLLCHCSLFACCCCCSREKKQEGGRREEKREKKGRREGKNKKGKIAKLGNF